MSRPSGTPMDRAASTKSRSLRERNSPRMTRASHIQEKSPRKRITRQHRAAIDREEDQQQEDGGKGEHHDRRSASVPCRASRRSSQRCAPTMIPSTVEISAAPTRRERDAAAVDQTAQLVSSQLVGPEPVLLGWLGGDVEEVDLIFAVGRDRVGEDRRPALISVISSRPNNASFERRKRRRAMLQGLRAGLAGEIRARWSPIRRRTDSASTSRSMRVGRA